jgi:sugar/nucleoside kinase (ribokinase family)
MFDKNIDFLAIGDITTDAFIRLKEASVHCKVDTDKCELCMKFGDKIPFEYVKIVKAVGNSANAAVSVARIGTTSGIRSALMTQIGGDSNGKDCITNLIKEKVDTRYVKTNKDKQTNYHFVLWFEADRTILINHVDYEYQLPVIKKAPKWIYLRVPQTNI